MEEEQESKLNQLAERILQEKYDVICLQEVNQLVESEQVVQAPFYYAVDGAIPIHQDHYALRLVEKLAEAGLDYYWSWAYNHIGFDIYNEGVAILSRKPLKARELLVSDINDQVTTIHVKSCWQKRSSMVSLSRLLLVTYLGGIKASKESGRNLNLSSCKLRLLLSSWEILTIPLITRVTSTFFKARLFFRTAIRWLTKRLVQRRLKAILLVGQETKML